MNFFQKVWLFACGALMVALIIALLVAFVYALWRVWFWLVPAPWAERLGIGVVVVNLVLIIAVFNRKGWK